MVGRIDVVTGCMFAGKSTRAVATAQRSQFVGRRVFVIKHAHDTRYGKDGIATHSGKEAEVGCVAATRLLPLRSRPDYAAADAVVIDEGQWFDDLVAFCVAAAEVDNKSVSVFGLDGTFNREPFGQIAQLCPLADTFVKISALCRYCGDETPAMFSLRHRSSPGDAVTMVGGAELYSPVCRRHYLELSEPLSRST